MAHLQANTGVEVGQRFVQQQDLRLDRQRTPQRHTLALAARQFRHRAVAEALQAQHLQQFRYAPLDLVARHPPQLQTVADVLRHVHVRPQGIGLEHHRHAAALRRFAQDVASLYGDKARGRRRESGQGSKQGGFAAAGRSQQGDKTAGCDRQVDPFEHLVGPIGDAQIAYGNDRLHQQLVHSLFRVDCDSRASPLQRCGVPPVPPKRPLLSGRKTDQIGADDAGKE